MKKFAIVFALLGFIMLSASKQSTNSISLMSVPSGVNPPTGQRPYLAAVGPDPTIYVDYYCKGPGCAHVWRGQGGAHAFVAYAQDPIGRNFLEAHGAVGAPQLRATGPSGSVALYLRPQGSEFVRVRNAVQIVTEDANGGLTTIGYIGAHSALIGGDPAKANDLVIRAETGQAIRFFIGKTEKSNIQ